MVRANNHEDLLGVVLALSIFGSFQEKWLGFIWSFCPGGIPSTCVSSIVGTSWGDRIDPAAQAARTMLDG